MTTEPNKLLLGMVHLPPLPGSPGAAGLTASEALRRALESARHDARALVEGGLDGFFIENFNDHPFHGDRVPPGTLAAMTHLTTRLVEELAELPRRPFIGVNVLRNDALSALALATAVELDAIRVNVHTGAMVTDQGILEGRAAETLRERARVGSQTQIFADCLVKHASPLGSEKPDIAAIARETAGRGRADALIVTGRETGAATDLSRIRQVKDAVPATRVLAGSGVSVETAAEILEVADGAIIGTALKEGGRVDQPVDPARVRALVAAAREGK